jgi:ferredoxin
LLELAEKAGLDIGSDCRAGACLTCKTDVVEGAVTSDMGDGSALLCIGRPRTSRLTLDR